MRAGSRMPEGHRTHRLAGAHQRRYGGSSVAVSSPQGHFAAAAAKLDRRVQDRPEDPLATLLMDQAVISGIGNIYRAELFRHRLNPLQPGREFRADQWLALWSDLVELMHDGVRSGRIDTVRPEHDPVAIGRPSTQGPAWRRGLCLPPGPAHHAWCALPTSPARDTGTQPLLVSSLPAKVGGLRSLDLTGRRSGPASHARMVAASVTCVTCGSPHTDRLRNLPSIGLR
jgi:hypothetical protein